MVARFGLIILAIILLVAGIGATMWGNNTDGNDTSASVQPVVVPKLTLTQKRGQAAYTETCAQCHGVNGVGTDQGPPFLHRVYHPGHHADGAFFLAVRNGTRRHHWSFGDMPPQPHVSDGDISAIISFVRALQQANGFAPKK